MHTHHYLVVDTKILNPLFSDPHHIGDQHIKLEFLAQKFDRLTQANMSLGVLTLLGALPELEARPLLTALGTCLERPKEGQIFQHGPNNIKDHLQKSLK